MKTKVLPGTLKATGLPWRPDLVESLVPDSASDERLDALHDKVMSGEPSPLEPTVVGVVRTPPVSRQQPVVLRSANPGYLLLRRLQMNKQLILAYKLSKLTHRPVHALTNSACSRQLAALLEPWSRWCVVGQVAGVPDGTAICVQGTALTMMAHRLFRSVGLGSFAARALRFAAAAIGLETYTISDDLDSVSTMDRNFLQEVAHHDFEIGGKNEWDGADVKYSGHILRLLSEVHCQDYFPMSCWEELAARRVERKAALSVLDVGCGPLSWLRYGQLNGLLEVTGIDPLCEVYELILARHGLSRLRCIKPTKVLALSVEDLPAMHPKLRQTFDMVWTNNALDHTRDPTAAIAAIACALRPDGFAIIQVATKEASRQQWSQLHQFDFDIHGDWLTSTDANGLTVNVIGPGCALELSATLHYGQEGLSILATPRKLQSPTTAV